MPFLDAGGNCWAIKSTLTRAPVVTIDNLVHAHGILLSNYIDSARVTRHTSKQIKWALKQVPNISNVLGDPVTVG